VSRKFYVLLSVLLLASILSGCGLLGTKTSTSGAAEVTPQIVVVTATPGAEEKIVVVTATPEPATPTPEFIIITATPENTTEATATTAASSSSSSTTPTISMANTYMQDVRNMYVSWNADGDMEKGFQVVWSYTNNTPTFPQDSSTYISDVNSRVVTIQVEPGHTYYVRVCRFNTSGQCDLYSNTTSLSSGPAVPTAVYYQPPIHQPPYHPSNGTATATATSTSVSVNEAAYINLYSIRSSENGTAIVHWSATGTFPYGFIVLYSSASSYPTYGDYQYYTVSSSTARSATVSGGVGTTVYYRVCRLTSSAADSCSNVRSFKY
jgi:hypothetical protein